MKRNPAMLSGFERSDLQFIGRDLQRPECILAEKTGTLWNGGCPRGVMRILPDGTQTLTTQEAHIPFGKLWDWRSYLPENPFHRPAFSANGDILISKFGNDARKS